MRQISIDFDVHKAIEIERQSFEESENDVLRRLLKLGTVDTASAPASPNRRGWSAWGVLLPHGTQLKMTYNGVTHTGVIQDGDWHVEGATYTSPSGAASGVARTKNGGRTRLDGWGYWEVQRPGEQVWRKLGALWEEAKQQKKV